MCVEGAHCIEPLSFMKRFDNTFYVGNITIAIVINCLAILDRGQSVHGIPKLLGCLPLVEQN